jgi:hypothetical protein
MRFFWERWWIFRILSLAGLILVAFRPVTVRPHPQQSAPWAVLLDTSLSMKTKDPLSRFDQAKALAKDLRKYSSDEVYSFGSSTQKISKDAWDTLEAKDKKTDLAQSL